MAGVSEGQSGSADFVFNITRAGGALPEHDEGFTLTLANPVNTAIAVATAIILHEDIVPPPGLTIEQRPWGATIAGFNGDDSFTIHGGRAPWMPAKATPRLRLDQGREAGFRFAPHPARQQYNPSAQFLHRGL